MSMLEQLMRQLPEAKYAPLDTAPLLCNGAKIDFVFLIATMPGRHYAGTA